jgi:hypothetical protein
MLSSWALGLNRVVLTISVEILEGTIAKKPTEFSTSDFVSVGEVELHQFDSIAQTTVEE